MTTWHSLPPKWTGPQWREAVSDLLELHQFGAVRRVLAAVDAPASAVALADLGEALVNLDLHDARLPAVSVAPEFRERVAAVMWPATRDAQDRGPLRDLAPTYELLLEVMHVHMARGEWSSVLAVVHLMAEYLPLVAWCSEVGDAADPLRLRARMSDDGTRWHTDECPLNRAERGAFDSVLRDDDWDGYLRDRHSRIASALAVCGGVPVPVLTENSSRVCRNQCAVMDGVSDVAWRMTLARRFRDCSLLQLRHDAPVGHFFAVPGPADIADAWELAWQGLIADGVETPAGTNPATGLQPADWADGVAGLLGVVAGLGRAMQPGTLLSDVAGALRREVGAG